MKSRVVILVLAAVLVPGILQATSFVVPMDDELIAKSAAIVIATVEGSYVQENDGTIETVYEMRVERSMKGLSDSAGLLRIVSPGGVLGNRGLYVPSAAHFAQGERVLLFLTRERGRWQTTELTLGKFRFVASTTGEALLVRDMEDVVGWDHHGQFHREKVRREQGFLRFIDDKVRNHPATPDYVVESAAVTLASEKSATSSIQANAAFPAETYTDWVETQPIRWSNSANGVTYYKRADQDISGQADGGVSVIQSGLAAWTNECGSVINLIYGGTTSTVSRDFDATNVVEFNDPQGRISGSWGGSGTIGIAFLSFSSTHSFAGRTWWSISSGDVVFQDGYPGTHNAFGAAMTHELGHTIGWRHSNQDYATGGACNPGTQECTSAAIMNSSVSAAYGVTLQPWDVNAAQSVYPGGTCGPSCTPPSIAMQPHSTTIARGESGTLTVTATGTFPLTFQWYLGTSGVTSSPVSGATSSSLSATPNTTTSYWVRVSDACGSVNSNTATVTVTTVATSRTEGDFNGDGRADIAIVRPPTGFWYSNGFAPIQWGVNGDRPVPADYDGDGRTDVAVWRPATGVWMIRHSSSNAFIQIAWGQSGDIPVPADYNGDGRADVTVFRPSTGTWYSNGGFTTKTWGQSGDIPVPADFNGDGRADITIFRPVNGTWYSDGGFTTRTWGQNGDIPVPADYDGDGDADVAVFRPSTGIWYPTVGPFGPTQWGASGDIPVPADFNGDRRADLTVFRPSTGMWYSNGGFAPTQWGQSGDIPVVRLRYGQ